MLSENNQTLKRLGVQKIGVFGSFARNQQTDDSDIDFLVEFLPDMKNFDNYMDLYFFLKELFKIKIDLKTINSLPVNRNFTQNVLKEIEYATF